MLALVGSQFYIFPSGLPQPSHILLAVIIAFTIIFLSSGFFCKSEFIKYKYVFLFLGYSTVVNVVWALVEQDPIFLMASAYWFFGVGLLISAGVYLKNDGAVNVFRNAAVLGILLLAFFLFVGLGKPDYFPRYTAYFNDPNQFAFWVLCSIAIYFMLSSGTNNKLVFLFLTLMTGCLVVSSLSRSALIGFAFILVGVYIKLQTSNGFDKISNVAFSIFVSVLLIVIFVVFLDIDYSEIDILNRLFATDFGQQADIRGYYRAVEFPEYLFFGAGQGLDYRFNTIYEVHSSWMGLFFYYGFFGILLFSLFLIQMFFKLDFSQKVIFLGPLIYGFSTYGLRTPIFWFFIASVIYASSDKNIRFK